MDQEVMLLMIWSMASVRVGKALGISDVAVRKRCLTMNLSKPSRGFWAKAYAGYPVEGLIPESVRYVLERYGYDGDFVTWREGCLWIQSEDPLSEVKEIVRRIKSGAKG